VIAGDYDVVSQGVENVLTAMGITVTRSYGDTRYGTSTDLAGRFFPDSVNAIAATGLNYPDALAAVPLAAKMNAAIILVTQDSVTAEVSAYLPYSETAHITVVGDDGTVGQAVKEELLDLLE
jgi:putative cell wall-binding protein